MTKNSIYISLLLALSACAPATTTDTTQPVVVTQPQEQPPQVAPLKVEVVTTPPPVFSRLVTYDSSELTVTLLEDLLRVELTPGIHGAWFRLLVNGSVSKATGDYIGMSDSLPILNFSYIPGLEVQTAPTISGPWVTVAKTQ